VRIVCTVARAGNCASGLGGNTTNREAVSRHLTEFVAERVGYLGGFAVGNPREPG
jgi:hypothetical protein